MKNQENNTKGLTIAPLNFEFNTAPGKYIEFSQEILNNNDTEIKLTLEILNLDINSFVKKGELNLSSAAFGSRTPATWIVSDYSSITIPPKSKFKIPFKLNVPETGTIDDFYPVVVYRNLNNASSNNFNIGLEQEIVSIIAVNTGRVEGAETIIELKGEIIKFELEKHQVIYPQQNFEVSLINTGNSFFKPRGKITVKNSYGQTIAPYVTINDDYFSLLPGEELTEKVLWSPLFEFKLVPDFGKYTATLEIFLDPYQKIVLKDTKEFWVIPVFHILFALIVFFTAAFFIVRKLRKRLNISRNSKR